MALPEELAGYRVEGVLGEGGFGVVYAAAREGARVALKVYRHDLELSEREVQRFVKEAEMLAAIAHPAVVSLLAHGVLDDGRPFLVMPRLEGESLADRLDRGPIPLSAALAIFAELAAALEALHEAALVHRDLKPENVMLCEGRPILLDLGIAKALYDGPSTTTQAGRVRGTPAYMAPERFFGAPASPQSDIYELALVLYAMVVGRLPWADPTSPAERHRPASPANAGVGRALAAAILAALALEPRQRPQSVGAFATLVSESAAEDAKLAHSTTESIGLGPSPPPREPVRWVDQPPGDEPPRRALTPDRTPPGSSAALPRGPRRWVAPALVAAFLATIPWVVVRGLDRVGAASDIGAPGAGEPQAATQTDAIPPEAGPSEAGPSEAAASRAAPSEAVPSEPLPSAAVSSGAGPSAVVGDTSARPEATPTEVASRPEMRITDPTASRPSSEGPQVVPLGPEGPPPPAPWCDKLVAFFCSPDMVAYSETMCPTWKGVIADNGRLYARLPDPSAHDRQCKNHYDTMVPRYRESMLAWKARQAEIAEKARQREEREAARKP